MLRRRSPDQKICAAAHVHTDYRNGIQLMLMVCVTETHFHTFFVDLFPAVACVDSRCVQVDVMHVLGCLHVRWCLRVELVADLVMVTCVFAEGGKIVTKHLHLHIYLLYRNMSNSNYLKYISRELNKQTRTNTPTLAVQIRRQYIRCNARTSTKHP